MDKEKSPGLLHEGMQWKPIEELTFSDDVIFKVHCEQGRAVRLLALHLEHGVRFDLLAKGSDTLMNMEMQVLVTKGLSERSMYYLSSLVVLSLDRGERYEKLGRSIVIFLCKADPFDKGLAMYEFTMRATNPRGMKLTDKASVIFYNMSEWERVRGKGKQALFRYIMTGEVVGDVAGQLDAAVAEAKRNDKAQGALRAGASSAATLL